VQRGKGKRRPAPRAAPAVGFTGAKRKVQRYGWVPDLPDQRDHTYAVPARLTTSIQANVDLREQCPPVYDQGELGSCTANAIAAALEFDMMAQGMSDVWTPSRLFIYYNERVMEGTVDSDAGAQIRDGIKSVASQGDCPEDEWPYDISQFAVQPPQSCYDDAVKHKAVLYQSVSQNLADMKGCLASGFPFVYGFTVYESFESDAVAKGDKAGWVPMPQADEQAIGGHAVIAVGYDDDDRVFICRNSWGDQWGDAGYFYMPYAYLLDDNLADDFWTIRLVQ
jgi:C1A family cysteine protease